MIKTDGCSSNEFHLASFQQFTVTTVRVRITNASASRYIPGGKTTAGQIHHFIGYLFDSFMYIRYFIIYNYFHLSKLAWETKVDTFTE